MREEAEYFSKDFEWEELRKEVENNSNYSHHFLPFEPSSCSSSSKDSDAWQSFHNRHSTGKFFKERRYLLKEFPELLHCDEHSKVLEVGCGNGSTVLPILRGNQGVVVYACDCSSEALERAKEMICTFDKHSFNQRFHPFICHFSQNGFPNWLICNLCRTSSTNEPIKCIAGHNENANTDLVESSYLKQSQCCIGGVDFVTLIFTLSAVESQSMPAAIMECISSLKPGGLLLFRDYGLYDMTMLRFEPNKRMGFREYMRSDGTRSYFFSLDTVRELFLGAGFIELELEYCCVKSVNRRKGKTMHRVWVHGKFQKPI
ncbi:Methyltransferase-like protein [Thalictrum thalictroides]|uniref:tRNA N(3)-methylcytidine methyltransferase n=1 Tax=Thalictrum thalictroides TaxID=46969 RepID=A0A7J6V9A6_THATH|nr:Methyltransferase-like protein [Thalictrum thalictroides]